MHSPNRRALADLPDWNDDEQVVDPYGATVMAMHPEPSSRTSSGEPISEVATFVGVPSMPPPPVETEAAFDATAAIDTPVIPREAPAEAEELTASAEPIPPPPRRWPVIAALLALATVGVATTAAIAINGLSRATTTETVAQPTPSTAAHTPAVAVPPAAGPVVATMVQPSTPAAISSTALAPAAPSTSTTVAPTTAPSTPPSEGSGAAIDAARAEQLVLEGNAFRRSRSLDLARNAFTEAQRLDPSNRRAVAGLALVALAQGDAEIAVRWARQMVEAAPQTPSNYVLLGDALAAMNDREGARRAYRQALEMRPRDRSIRRRLRALR